MPGLSVLELKTHVKTELWEGQKMLNIYEQNHVYILLLTLMIYLFEQGISFYHKTYLRGAELQFPKYL